MLSLFLLEHLEWVFMLSEPEWLRQNKQTKTTTNIGMDMGKEECSYIVSGSMKPDTVTEEINRSYFIMYSIEFTLSFVFRIIKMTNLNVI